ncbi:MAG: FadR family transcriptional regulator [Phycisphaerae bacterium]|nr:FadR family transcriptional regulator [Phycisphaerae bacterium]
MATVKRQTLSEQVVGRIKQYIIDNGLKPGDRLPTEQEMAERFGVSRISVREATKALSFLGIIRAAPRRGLTVGKVDMKRVTEFLGFHFALNDYAKSKLLNARIAIESGALPFTMQRISEDPSLAERLSELIDRLDQDDSPDAFIEGDIAFHRALVESSGIEPLVAFTDLLHVFFKRFREGIVVAERKRGNVSHRRILDLLQNQQVDAAQDELRRHLEYYKGYL